MKVFKYFIDVFKKGGPHKSDNVNIRMMHGINRISILMFLLALIILIYKWVS